ncbi:Uncharacterised protein [Mycobacteroides abscessus]|nr:Uncharacterised protein [Mycobacteroides abscessus]
MRGYWYIIGATLIAVGLIGGIGLFVGGLMPVLQGPTSQFDANGSSTTRFGSGDSNIIYVADVEPVPKLTQNTRCVARDENNNDATVSRYDDGADPRGLRAPPGGGSHLRPTVDRSSRSNCTR